MFGIINENKKFILLDEDHDKLRMTALMLAKEVEETVIDYDAEGNPIGEHIEKHWEPMFTEDTVDDAIAEYTDEQIETAYNGDKYVLGYAPAIDNEYQSKMRERAYIAEVDPITSHISRLLMKEQTPDIVAEINELAEKRDAKVEEIKKRYPYSE